MAYSRSPLKKTGTLLFLNLLLIIFLLGVLHTLRIVDLTGLFKYIPFVGAKKSFKPGERIEDPNLLEREELAKHWAILNLREQLYQKRLLEIEKKDRNATAKFEQVEQQRRKVEERIKALKEKRLTEESRKKNIKDLASKYANMRPQDAVKIMLNLDNVIVIDVLKQMDRDAVEQGKQTLTPYLLSLMSQKNPKKAAEISRLISRYPSDAEASKNTAPEGTKVPEQQQQQ